VHAAVLHQFSSGERTISSGLDLRARARQFSSFILLVGKVSGRSAAGCVAAASLSLFSTWGLLATYLLYCSHVHDWVGF
jgi:hypothetical protein